MSIWDNQQVTRDWFCGILEGEGSFRNTKKSNVEVRISNTDLDIIEACESFLKKHFIVFSTSEGQRLDGRKREYSISIRRSREMIFNYPQLLFDIIKDSLECRRKEYESILGTSETTCDLSVSVDWLIGIFEAEGSFSITLNNRRVAALSIEVANTDPVILNKAALAIKSLGCSWYVQNNKAINIYGMKRCLRFLRATNGKWICERNRKRTSLMLEFIETRFTMNQKDDYTSRQFQIIQTLRDLNR